MRLFSIFLLFQISLIRTYDLYDTFYYEFKDKIFKIDHIVIPEIISRCSVDIPIEFVFENNVYLAFLTNKKYIISTSENRDCPDKLTVFMETENYSIKILQYHVGVFYTDSFYATSTTPTTTSARVITTTTTTTTTTTSTPTTTTRSSYESSFVSKCLQYEEIPSSQIKKILTFLYHFFDDLNDYVLHAVIFVLIISKFISCRNHLNESKIESAKNIFKNIISKKSFEE